MSKRPVAIRRGSFVCVLHDINSFMDMPLANVRKLWKIMFDAEDENRETIEAIRAWLDIDATTMETAIAQRQTDLKAAEAARKTLAVFGSAATEELKAKLHEARRDYRYAERNLRQISAAYVKAQKLQAFFNQNLWR